MMWEAHWLGKNQEGPRPAQLFPTEVKMPNLPHRHLGKVVRMVGEYVNYKPVRTKHGQIMMFFTFLDAARSFFDTVHFPDSLKSWKFQGNGVYQVEGKVTAEFGCYSLTVSRFAKMPIKSNPKNASFHDKELFDLRPRFAQPVADGQK